MSDHPDQIPEELHVLAGEYVLGALDAGEMRAVRRQAMATPGLAEAIRGWEDRLAPMAEAVPALPPPDALWSRIEQAIAPLPDEESLAPPPRVRLASVLPAEPPRPDAPPRAWAAEPQRRRVWPWQLATVASLALAAGVAGVVLMPSLALRLHIPVPGERFAPQLALLMPSGMPAEARPDTSPAQMATDTNTPAILGDARTDGTGAQTPAERHTPGFLVEARPDGTVLLKALARVEVPAGKALELWILPPGAAAPRSLGVLPAAGRRITLPAMPSEGTALMLSLEPPGGSPTGAPTGPVVFAGKLAQLNL